MNITLRSASLPVILYAFATDDSDLPGFQQQVVAVPEPEVWGMGYDACRNKHDRIYRLPSPEQIDLITKKFRVILWV